MGELQKLRRREVLTGDADRVRVTRVFRYDFADADQGGAVGAITLKGIDGQARSIPAGSVIHSATTVCRTAATSGGAATIALGITGAATAFETATAYTDNSYDTVGTVDLKTTTPVLVGGSDVAVLATVADAALTAGVFDVLVELTPPRG